MEQAMLIQAGKLLLSSSQRMFRGANTECLMRHVLLVLLRQNPISFQYLALYITFESWTLLTSLPPSPLSRSFDRNWNPSRFCVVSVLSPDKLVIHCLVVVTKYGARGWRIGTLCTRRIESI